MGGRIRARNYPLCAPKLRVFGGPNDFFVM